MSDKPTMFAERLQALREGRGLSQYALAKQAGLSKQSLSRLERGERQPTWETVQLLALALGVDCREFTDTGLTVPGEQPPGKPGRPRKAEPPAAEPGKTSSTPKKKTKRSRKKEG